MAVRKSWRRRAAEERWTGTEMHTDGLVSVLEGSVEGGGGMLEDQPRKRGSDLTQAGLSEGTLYMPRFTVPSKGATLGPFEVLDHPAGILKTCRR